MVSRGPSTTVPDGRTVLPSTCTARSSRTIKDDPLGNCELTFESRVSRALRSSPPSSPTTGGFEGETPAEDATGTSGSSLWADGASGNFTSGFWRVDAWEEACWATAREGWARQIGTRHRRRLRGLIITCPRMSCGYHSLTQECPVLRCHKALLRKPGLVLPRFAVRDSF